MFLLPFLVLSSTVRKNTWYLYPILPAMALITALGLARIRGQWRRGAALGLASMVGLLMLLFHTLAPRSWLAQAQEPVTYIERRWTNIGTLDLQRLALGGSTSSFPASATLLADYLRRAPPPDGEVKTVALMADSEQKAMAFRYLVELQEPRLLLVHLTSSYAENRIYRQLDRIEFDFLVCVNDSGLRPCRFTEEGVPSEKALQGSGQRDCAPPKGHCWPAGVQQSGERRWQKVEVAAGKPIYVASTTASR